MVDQSDLMLLPKEIDLIIKVEASILDKAEVTEEDLEKIQLLTLARTTGMPRRVLFQGMLARKLCYDIDSFIILKYILDSVKYYAFENASQFLVANSLL